MFAASTALRTAAAAALGADHQRLFIVGGHITPFVGKGNPDFIDKRHPDFGKRKNDTIEEVLAKTVDGTLTHCGPLLRGKERLIDVLAVGNFCGELFCSQGHLGAALVGSLTYGEANAAKYRDVADAFMGKPCTRVEGACASGGLAILSVANALRTGAADIGLAVGVEVQTTASPRVGGDYLARASHYATQRGIDDFTFPCVFARRVKALVEAGRLTMDDIARVAEKDYENASKNPLAHMHHAKLRGADAFAASEANPCFLQNAAYRPYMRVRDCSQVSDGGAGIVLATEAGLTKLGLTRRDPRLVEVRALEQGTGNLYADPVDLTRMTTSQAVFERALQRAGVGVDQVQVAEVHDCFAVTELLMYEAMGLCKVGEAAAYFASGATRLDGAVPVNTGGGLVAFGHPVGATGVKQLVEVYRQMKGD
ncbi:3-ketoacyl-CoA thiolase [Strigomonas culicis]|uniref:propanoyl-CoA C-acyltransferase n=1 Tax=Strigomonas culicis TaxID=28005 RepID=S9U2A1_9TRYP|nr:3-ketoacyl-CoA thiolase [Strigomonas culicis]|eukprot:EPY23068.1 3-ketoacyl-CoA thiolase [Strigomonas culicis]